MFCNNCGTELEDGMMFCSNCGAEVASGSAGSDDDEKTVILSEGINETENTAEPADTDEEKTETERVETVEVSPTGVIETGTAMVVSAEAEQKRFCPNCGKENGINDLFCQECGMFFGNADEKMAGGSAAAKTGKAGKIWKIAAIAAALLIVVGLGIVFVPRLFGESKESDWEKDFVLYLKDNELTMARKSKYEPIAVGDRLFADKDGIGNTYQYAYSLISYTPDHKYVYYPQKADGNTCDLCRKKLGDKKAEEVKIDSQIVDYKVLDNDRLVYIKDSTDRKLYLYQKGESEKIASNVWDMKVSADGKYVLWQADGKLYVQNTNLKSDKVKLDSDVSNIYGVSEDFGTIVYRKNDNLYVMKGMDESEKIASDIYNMAYVYDIDHSLKIHYLKEGGEKSLSYYDLIEDDLLAQDQQIEEPKIEDYQTITYEDSFWGLREVVEVDYDSYNREADKYWQKQSRDYLREYLKSETVEMSEYDIYYYEDATGDSNKILTVSPQGGMTYGNYGSIGTNTALMYVGNMDLEKIDGVKFSKLADSDYYEIGQQIEDKMGKGRQLLYIENGESQEIDFECEDNYPLIWANEEKHMIYLRGNDYKELYRLDYKQKNDSPELIADDVSQVATNVMDDVCYINEDEELYFGEKKIDEDVYNLSVWENGMILYMTDVDKDGEEGTLHLYQRGKSVEIADDVAVGSYGMFDSDKIAFLTDYNFRKYRGDLNVYDGKKVKKIDSDVTKIIF